MTNAIDLNRLIEEMDVQFDEYRTFFNKKNRYNIENDLYKYKKNRLKEIAIRWCKGNDIEYK